MIAKPTTREHWHTCAIKLAQLDSLLLELVGDDRALCNLRTDVYQLLLRKLDELVGDACRAEIAGTSRKDIQCEMAKAIWNFLTPWKGSTNVPRGTVSPTKQFGAT